MQISRRSALLGASAAAVAVAGVSRVVQGEDAHLEALHAEYRAAEARHDVANSIADEAMGAVYQSLGRCPLNDYLSGEVTNADMEAHEAAKEALIESSGAGELKRREHEAAVVERAAFNRFMEAPSQTPRGLYLKFKAGIDEGQWEDRAELQFYENIMLRAIRADLERLAKTA